MMYDTTAFPPRAATWARTIANTSAMKACKKPLTPPSYKNKHMDTQWFIGKVSCPTHQELIYFLQFQNKFQDSGSRKK